MPSYHFICDSCVLDKVIEAPMSQFPRADSVTCDKCGAKMRRDFSGIRVDVFKPFTDYHVSTSPVTFETREQRDRFCQENNVTYDRIDYHRRPQYKSAVDSLTLDEVMLRLKNEGPPKEELVQDPGEVASVSADISDSSGA